MESLCRLFGYTRQAYWKSRTFSIVDAMDETALLHEVREIRRELPRIGVRKLQVMLYQRGHDVGRDSLFDLLRGAGLLVSRKRFRVRTTNSRHWMRKWDNLIRDVVPICMNQIWVSDITYVEIKSANRSYWMYLSLITDAYTHEIVGYALHDTLDTRGPLQALEMALNGFPHGSLSGLIHHSDRGAQYCSKEYVSELQRNGILISMTENGDPYENAIAERTNGILKTEWLYQETLRGPSQARKRIGEIIFLYNNVRPHLSIGNLTPVQARSLKGEPAKLWKNYFIPRQGLPA